jgi:hypothetical protein
MNVTAENFDWDVGNRDKCQKIGVDCRNSGAFARYAADRACPEAPGDRKALYGGWPQ